jgi:hypothetical protein
MAKFINLTLFIGNFIPGKCILSSMDFSPGSNRSPGFGFSVSFSNASISVGGCF